MLELACADVPQRVLIGIHIFSSNGSLNTDHLKASGYAVTGFQSPPTRKQRRVVTRCLTSVIGAGNQSSSKG